MYRKNQQAPTPPESFEFPSGGKLSSDNRWVIMAKLIPWEEFEKEYIKNFVQEKGAPAKSFRMALGALIIKEFLRTSDRETREQIRENPYLQYFLGMSSYTNEEPFDASMLVYFRQRINIDLVNKINLKMVSAQRETSEDKSKEEQEKEEGNERTNRGKLILDATCAPGDISYPNDLGILNKAREHTEKIIDTLYKPIKEKLKKKPRTYRKRARKDYLEVAKKRRVTKKERRKAIKKQLQYIKRNNAHIQELITLNDADSVLSKKQNEMFEVGQEVYRQQSWMYENKKQSIEKRIVSLTQPHVRPIVARKSRKTSRIWSKIVG